jgi:hypothetical protein
MTVIVTVFMCILTVTMRTIFHTQNMLSAQLRSLDIINRHYFIM